jgi:hypothetical protein
MTMPKLHRCGHSPALLEVFAVSHPIDAVPKQLVALRPDSLASGAMRLLATGVPLSLLMDLADPLGPDSIGILHNESPRQAPVTLDTRASATAS